MALRRHAPAGRLDISTGTRNTVIAVVDPSIPYEPGGTAAIHPDFGPERMLRGFDFVSNLAAAGDGDDRDADP